MPDLKFKDGKIFFSALNDPNGKWPLLLPRISNPKFLNTENFTITGPPGIVELIKGDLGITEMIASKLLEPIFITLKANPFVIENLANQSIKSPSLEELNPNAIQTEPLTGDEAFNAAKRNMLANSIPGSVYLPSSGEPTGLKSLERTIITSMMESHKPLMDFLEILISILSIGEDVVCRFLGTSIKVLGKEIGIPSRNPKYWDKSLGYAQTLTYAQNEFNNATIASQKAFNESMPNSNPIKNNIPNGQSDDSDTIGDDREAIYVGYFDEDGNIVDPPQWIKDSNKWVRIVDKDNKVIGSPFIQLKTNLNEGVKQIKDIHQKSINQINKQQDLMVDAIVARIKDLENKYKSDVDSINNSELTKEQKANQIKELTETKNIDLQSLEAEKIQAVKEMKDLVQCIQDTVDGTNIAGNNLIDDNDPSQGINPPGSISEWIAKLRGSQFRQKYFPDAISTTQTLVDKNGEAIEPYIYIPRYKTNYNGRTVEIEVPLAYKQQISNREVNSNNFFYEQKQKDKGRTFSYQNYINSLDLYYQTDNVKPYSNDSKTHFNHNIKGEYIPDAVKNYYLPLEWEEVEEYEIRYKSNPSKVIGTEIKIIPHKIDVENDYELRLIKVVNMPLLPPVGQSGVLEYFPNDNDLVLLHEGNEIQFIRIKQTIPTTITFKTTTSTITTSVSGTNGTGGVITTSSITTSTKTEPNKFNLSTRYVDENYLSDNKYFFIKKENSIFGEDDILKQIFQIKEVKRNWIGLNINLGADNVIIESATQTIRIKGSYLSGVPNYIMEALSPQIRIDSDGVNKNKTIRIIKWSKLNDNHILRYEGSLNSDTINNNWNISYLESSYIETVQNFDNPKDENVIIYPISEIDYIPPFLDKPRPIIIQGLDKDSLLTTIINKEKRNDIDPNKFTQPDLNYDGIYNVSKIKTKNINGINFKVLQLTESLPVDFANKIYSGDKKSNLYFPLRILAVPNLPNDSSTFGDSFSSSKGTLYTYNHNIPDVLKTDDEGNSLKSNNHSTPDINSDNLLKEGIIYHGLDPRFVDRTKWKTFWLVEAIKKNGDGIAPINRDFNKKELENVKNGKSNGGKLWYGLLDKFTALPMIITKLVPLIATKLIPLIVKIIQLISNPSKIKTILTDMITNKSISKVPKNFPAFDSSNPNGTMSKIAKEKNKKPPKSFDEPSTIKPDSNYYAGPQIGKENPQIECLLDGKAVVPFGKGINNGKPMFSFGLDVKLASDTPFKSTSSKKQQTDFNSPPPDKTQSTFEMILSFIKMPFEIIFMIFKWAIDWIKKMMNPTKIPSAIAEFITFKWLKDIIGKDSLFNILGIEDPLTKINERIQTLLNANGQQAQALHDQALESIQKGSPLYEEVLIYHLFRNGVYVKEEVETRPYSGNIDNLKDNANKGSLDNSNPNNNETNTNKNKNNDTLDDLLAFLCGPRFFSINELLPIPFWSDSPKYTLCELPIVFLKPLEMILGILKIIQEILNALISMPMSILGLDPQIPIPKFGKEIPFANVFEDTLNQLKARLQPISVQ